MCVTPRALCIGFLQYNVSSGQSSRKRGAYASAHWDGPVSFLCFCFPFSVVAGSLRVRRRVGGLIDHHPGAARVHQHFLEPKCSAARTERNADLVQRHGHVLHGERFLDGNAADVGIDECNAAGCYIPDLRLALQRCGSGVFKDGHPGRCGSCIRLRGYSECHYSYRQAGSAPAEIARLACLKQGARAAR
jgi:hypothetical protein